MTDRINHIIDEIRSKKNELLVLLEREKENSAQKDVKIGELEVLVGTQKSKVDALTDKTLSLKNELEAIVAENEKLQQEIVRLSKLENSQNLVSNHVQIDELVREIEYCIGRLKNNE